VCVSSAARPTNRLESAAVPASRLPSWGSVAGDVVLAAAAWDFISYVYNPANQVGLVTTALLIVGGVYAAAMGSFDIPAAPEIDSTTG
jgi:hypothetical protein